MVAEGFPSLAYWRVGPTEAKRLKGEKGAIGDYGPTFHPEPPHCGDKGTANRQQGEMGSERWKLSAQKPTRSETKRAA